MNNRIGIVVLNYNNVHDTLHAVQSIIQAKNSHNHTLVVVDNASTDDSWSTLNSTNTFQTSVLDVHNSSKISLKNLPVVHLVQSFQNKGYAYGNNCGIKQCLLDSSIQFVWVLNNDIEIKSDCIIQIESALKKSNKSMKLIWGTLLVNFDSKNTLQAIGGKYFPLWAKTKLLLPNLPLKHLQSELIEISSKQSNYFIGASLIFSKLFLDEVGLFNEQYFLYAEEIDIFYRGRQKGFDKLMIEGAIVYHKEGSTTKSTNQLNNIRNTFIEFHNCRSKLIFTKNYYPTYYPIVYLLIMINLLWIYKRNLSKALFIWKCLRKDVYAT